MAIDPIIKQKADDIRHKIYGKEVRESLASGIEAMSEDVEATISRQDYVEEQFQNVIDETTDKDVISAPELIAARNGKSNLKTRLDDEHAQVTAQLQQTETILEGRGVSPMKFGAVADGITDDTIPLQQAIDFAKDNNLPVDLNGNFATRGTILKEDNYITGVAKFVPVEENQDVVVSIEGRISWTSGNLYVNGKNKALHGVRVSAFINSHIAEVRVDNCKIWGFTFDTKGNNNTTRIDKFIGLTNGREHLSGYTIASADGKHKTLSLNIPLNNYDILKNYNIIYVLVGNIPYLVRKINSESSIELYNFNGVVGDTGTVSILVGGGLNIPGYGDNGVGSWGSVDIFGNTGVGLNMSSLYGHTFNRFVAQGNGIAMACTDISIGVNLVTPYFELNKVDIVVGNYIEGTMIDPVIEYDKIFNITNKSLYGFDLNHRLNIMTPLKSPNMSTEIPYSNPTNRQVYPSKSYAFDYNSNQKERTFIIHNDVLYKNTLSTYIDISVNTEAGMEFTFILDDNDNGETVQGFTSFTTNVFGKAHFKVYYIESNKEWKIETVQEPMKRTGVPLIGRYEKGHLVYNSNPTSGGYVGWVCVEAGDPGVWKPYGMIE